MSRRTRPTLKHGLSYTPEYRAWQLMRLRCMDPKHAAYPDYGGRGITLHAAWIEDPAAFIAHIGPRPTPKHEVDRIKNGEGYEPGNVRWVTRKVNSRNRRSNRMLSYRGEELTLAEWCERLGLRGDTVTWRIESGMTVEEAFETPVREKAPNGQAVVPELVRTRIAWTVMGVELKYTEDGQRVSREFFVRSRGVGYVLEVRAGRDVQVCERLYSTGHALSARPDSLLATIKREWRSRRRNSDRVAARSA